MENNTGGIDYRQVVKDMHSVGMMYFYLASKISADNPEGHSKASMETLDMVLEAINQMIADGDSGIDTDTLGKYREATEKCIGVHNNNTNELKHRDMENIANARRVLVSRIKTPDGTVLESRYTHDFVQHTDANGELYFLDGGPDYKRTSVNTVPAEDVSIYTDSPFHEIRTHLKRGTFDKEGNRIWKPLKDLSDKHLENILEYNRKLGGDNSTFSEMVRREIEYRRRHGITIEDDWKEYGKRPVKAD